MTPNLPVRRRSSSHVASAPTMRSIRHALHGLLLAIIVSMPLLAIASPTAIVFSGETAPDTNGGTFATPVAPDLNNAGEVAFYSTIADSDVLEGIFASDGTSTRSVVLTGDVAPGTSGGVFLSIFTLAQINDSGNVAFSAAIGGGTAFSGLFLETAGVVTPIALSGDPAPGTSGTYLSFLSSFIALNNVGQIAAVSGISGFPPTQGLFIESAAGGNLIALTGDPVPGIPGALFENFTKPSINDSGDVAFEASISNQGTNTGGLFRYTSGSVVVIALEDEIAPGTGGGTFTNLDSTPSALDNSGNVYFQSRISGGSTVKGLFLGDGITTSAIVLEGDAVPYPGGATVDELNNSPTTSGNGNAAFVADLIVQGAQTERASFVDAADGSGLSFRATSGEFVPNTGGGSLTAPSAPSINDAGTIAYSSAISGGTESFGIFIPEPNFITGLSIGLLTLMLRRERTPRRESKQSAVSGRTASSARRAYETSPPSLTHARSASMLCS